MNAIVQQKFGENSTLIDADFVKWFEKRDIDKSGVLDKEEVITMFLKLLKGKNPVSKNQLKQIIYAGLIKEVNDKIAEVF